uniref:Uncharacterized protein n=1 Tax=Plectus sambesii TaxID=2011161 RepID=A0A914URD0_9BILA
MTSLLTAAAPTRPCLLSEGICRGNLAERHFRAEVWEWGAVGAFTCVERCFGLRTDYVVEQDDNDDNNEEMPGRSRIESLDALPSVVIDCLFSGWHRTDAISDGPTHHTMDYHRTRHPPTFNSALLFFPSARRAAPNSPLAQSTSAPG